MARKAATATFPGTSVPIGAPPPVDAPKRARPRVIEGGAPIDCSGRNARKELDARYPRVTNDETIDAPAEGEHHARLYLDANKQIGKLEVVKDLAGNHLRAMIGGNAAIEGEGYRAAWFERVGEVDWQALAKAHGISDATIDKFRKPGGRSLKVTGKG